MQRQAVRNLKITRAFYCYHPNTYKWVVEWTVKEFKNRVLEHYQRTCDTEQEAKEVLSKLGDIFGGFLPYKPTTKNDFLLSAGEFVGYIDTRTKFTEKSTNL